MEVVQKEAGKFEQVYVTGGDAVIYFARVFSPKLKHQSDSEKEYSLTLFVDEATKDKLESHTDDGGVFINKQFFLVGKDKNKKKKIKFPTSDQVEEGKAHYDMAKGMYGVSLTAPEYKKNGDKVSITVVDADGNPIPKNTGIGNGSKGNIRAWGYRNDDGQLNITLDLVQVTDLIEYEVNGAGGGFDDVLGIDTSKAKSDVPKGMDAPSDVDDFDDDVPFS